MQRVRDRLRAVWAGQVRAYEQGDPERLTELLDAEDRVQVELAAAKDASRAETAARLADPEAPRLRAPEDAPAGWTADPQHYRSLSPVLQRRLAETDAADGAGRPDGTGPGGAH